MKFFSQVFIALVAASLFYQNAMAINQSPRVESYPVLKPGARFSYVDGIASLKCNQWEIQEVKDVNKSGLVVSKCGGNTIYMTADSGNPVMVVNDQEEIVIKTRPFYPELSFPLFVGKKWSGKYYGQEGSYRRWSGNMACESTAFESVQVAAGKIDAFRIDCVDEWDSGIIFVNGTIESTRWYDPASGLIIKNIHDFSKWNYEFAGGDWRNELSKD